jgi:hypothetical protein
MVEESFWENGWTDLPQKGLFDEKLPKNISS